LAGYINQESVMLINRGDIKCKDPIV